MSPLFCLPQVLEDLRTLNWSLFDIHDMIDQASASEALKQASPWHPHGIPMASPLHPHCIPMASLWHLCGIPVAFLWHPYDILVASPWHPYDIHIASPQHPQGVPTGSLWHHKAPPLITPPYGILSHNLASCCCQEVLAPTSPLAWFWQKKSNHGGRTDMVPRYIPMAP